RRRLAHVYVDELADTDPAQLDLLAVLAGGGKSLVAFADPDSATYAFRGTDPAGVAAFPHRFRTASGAPAAQVVLTTSYRAGPGLIAATRRLAGRLRGPAAHRRLRPLPDAPPGTVEVRTFRSATSEAAWLAQALRAAHLLDGVPWSRMAVLVRSTARQLPALRRALHTAGVPTVVHGEDLPLHLQPAVAPLLLLLRCALEPARLDEEAAVALLHSPLGGADPLAERRLRQGLRALALAVGDRRPSGELIVDALRDPEELSGIDRHWAEPAQAVAGLLAIAREAAQRPGATAEDVLWAVWDASGLAERWAGAIALGRAATGEHETARRWRAEAADRDLDAVLVLFDAAARFDAIELAARWMVGPERERAEAMVDKLQRWLAGNPRRLLAIEHEFAVRLDDPQRPVELTGRVDRLEVDADGRLVVVDLKTGKSTVVTEREIGEHPQLGAYQAAVEAGAFAEYGDESGGAALVQLGTGARDAREQSQPAAGQGPAAGWATALVRRTADTMAAATFAAVANSKCRVCPVRTSCPVSGQGRQVVEPPTLRREQPE
ncbi:PD-(D/E)XK nuclease family protein, partial [Micromonospora sp. DH15]|nr:PD-(D/E)XK nuclease family protein [Micromonospora sp. DH15]